jgi:AraC-like DNA-binding protein
VTDDGFLAFLGWLEAHLDAPTAAIGDAASDLLVSRAVLDRLVVAAAGEPPGGLRRRVLLERAAFQLRTTDRTILRVALDAGYGSHEAFTRAFERAYGRAPAAWRSVAAPLHRGDERLVHFYPPSGIRFPQRGATMPVNLPAGYFDHHVGVLSDMVGLAATLPDDVLDREIAISVPTIDDHPTIRSLLSRLIGQLQMWSRAMAGEPYDFGLEDHEPVAAMRERLDREGPAFCAFVREAGERDGLSETFVDTTCEEPFTFTAAGMVAHVLAYGSYRRTLAACALESATGERLGDDPMGAFGP